MGLAHKRTEEHEPLLIANRSLPPEAENDPPNELNVAAEGTAFRHIVIISYVLMTLSQFHAGIFNTALQQLVEGILCRQYHDNVVDPTTDPRCKAEQTQAELSLIFSLEMAFELIPGLLLSIPYGVAADVYGRRPVAFLSILGCLFYGLADLFICWKSKTLSPRWLWAVPLTTVMGGGAAVFPTMLYTMISDVAPKSQREVSSTAGAFVVLTTAPVLGRFASGPVLYWLMTYGEWHALIFAIIVWLPANFIILMVPETLNRKQDADRQQLGYPSSDSSSSFMAILSILLLSALSLEIGRFLVSGILPQYMTKRYQLEWKEANLWLSIKAVLQVVVGLLILPVTSRYLTKAGMPAVSKDAWIARTSLLLAMVGYSTAGLAEHLPIFLVDNVLSALSIGIEPAMRSLLVATARNSGSGALFSTLQVILSLGIVISRPLIATSFRLGLHMGQEWLGLPLL
ncbi:hypothetical protein NLG97_g3321 [Lecanicillium saksenae]|uniref:Uncharacterized protein n=1 Tax=Lecanicillium saksenae TaxID=468837 RepID=A0ACC1QZ15_9HYPO|nr:hypothetical protein NLG97_g3321 [Lecanicillium saksenae]